MCSANFIFADFFILLLQSLALEAYILDRPTAVSKLMINAMPVKVLPLSKDYPNRATM